MTYIFDNVGQVYKYVVFQLESVKNLNETHSFFDNDSIKNNQETISNYEYSDVHRIYLDNNTSHLVLLEFDENADGYETEINTDLLNEIINVRIFKEELDMYINQSADEFKIEIEKLMYSANIETAFRIELREICEKIDQTIDLFRSYENNDNLTKKIIESFINSYYDTLGFINDRYYKDLFLRNSENYRNVAKNYNLSREDLLKKLTQTPDSISQYEIYERKLVQNGFISKDYRNWQKGAVELVAFYIFCEGKKIIAKQHKSKTTGIKCLRELYDFPYGQSIDKPSKWEPQRKKVKPLYYFL